MNYELTETPNLSLNIGIKKAPLWVTSLVALTGLVLQSGIIILAGSGAWKLGWSKNQTDSETSKDYAPRMFIAGSILLCLGMWGCAALIGQATQEVRFKRNKQGSGRKSRLIWLQPGPQLVGEQSFDPSSYFESKKQPIEYWVSSRKRKGSERSFEGLTYLAVLASVVGYVLQFIGLRGMKAWLSLAQLGVTLFMSMLRGALRIQRLQNQDNRLAKFPDLVAGHELDWLAYELAFDDSPMQSVGQPQKGANWHVVSGKMPREDERMSVSNESSFATSDRYMSSRTNSSDTQALQEFITSPGCKDLYANLFSIRVQLAELTGNRWQRHLSEVSCYDKPWKSETVAVRKSALKLAEAFGEVATALLTGESRKQRGDLVIPVGAVGHTGLNDSFASILPHVVGVQMKAPDLSQPLWKVNPAQLEAVLGLWVWSLVSTQDIAGQDGIARNADKSKGSMNVSHQILAAGFDNENWQRDVDIGVELNFWFGPDTHHLSRETLRLSRDMRCDNFSTLSRPLTGAGGWEKLPESTDPTGALLSWSKSPIFHLRLFGWNIVCETLGIKGTDHIWRSDLVKNDRHVDIEVQYMRSQRSIIDLCTQQLFITLVKNLIDLAAINIPESVVSEREGFIQLGNPLVTSFEKAFVDAEIGSRADAVTTIISQLRRHLLPDDESMMASLIRSAISFRQKGEWHRAAVLLKWGCKHISPERLNGHKTDNVLQWQLFEKILQAAAEFYRCSTTIKDDKLGISYAKRGLEEMKEWFRRLSTTSSVTDDIDKCRGSIATMLACYSEVFERLEAEPVTTHKVHRTHPFVQAIDDVNRADALYHLCFLKTSDFGSHSLKPALPLAIRNQWTEIVDALFEMNVHPDSDDKSGRTGASYCAELGYIHLLQDLVSHGAFLDQSDNMSRTPMHWAALSGQDKIVNMLLEKGSVDLSRPDKKGIIPFWHAIYANHPGIVQAILDRGFAVDTLSEQQDCSPVSWAARYGHAEIVQLLVDRGAELNQLETIYHLSPLHFACDGAHEDIVRILLEAKADVNFVDGGKRNALHRAAMAGNREIVQLLLNLEVDVNIEDDSGRTPLHYAADYGHDGLLNVLVGRGAKIEAQDSFGRTPLLLAAQNQHNATTYPFVMKLLDIGATVDAEDQSEATALYRAAENRQYDLIEPLVRCGADPNHETKYGNTPLDRAAGRNYSRIVQKLVENGADINWQSREGHTALTEAAANGCMKSVQTLLELGATYIEDFEGNTPSMVAKKNGFHDIERFLNSHAQSTQS